MDLADKYSDRYKTIQEIPENDKNSLCMNKNDNFY